MAEEVAIAYTYLVVSILKLQSSRALNLAAYSLIKRYVVLLSQNLSPLLNLLFCLMLALHNMICIIWVGREYPTDTNLQ